MKKFSKILIANRGEIAVRIMRTAQRLGYSTVAVFSDPDQDALHTLSADEAVSLGGSSPAESYLVADKIIAAAQQAGADAIHPGYGFLSENAAFAERCAKEGIIFIGPTPAAIELMGSKRLSKVAMLDAGVPCIPGYQGSDQADGTLIKQAKTIGLPLMIKASAGGGGRGMRIVHALDDLQDQIDAARTEAVSAFGSDELILERALIEPRHIEIQVFGDTHGNYLHLGERDCSIQRRHQKVVEESPSPIVDEELRTKMGAAAVTAARSCNYLGAGTVEFLVDANKEFFFLEMNTRLQVEHPVTELVTGLDLVEWQISVAQGLPLPKTQEEVTFTGHAIEVRLCAEDPRSNFMPQTGHVAVWQPSELAGVRVDAGVRQGQSITPFYDSMIAKVIAKGATRAEAIATLQRGLSNTSLLGVHNNKHFLHTILGRPQFVEGRATTAFLAQEFAQEGNHPAEYQSLEIGYQTAAIAGCLLFARSTEQFVYPPMAWSVAEPIWHTVVMQIDGGTSNGASVVRLQIASTSGHKFEVSLDEQKFHVEVAADTKLEPSSSQSVNHRANMIVDGLSQLVSYSFNSSGSLVLDDQASHNFFSDITYLPVRGNSLSGDAEVKAAMDGVIVDVKVDAGDTVSKGQVLVVLEAMKMAHQLKADIDGTVEAVLVKKGQQVESGKVLVKLEITDKDA